MSPHGKYILFDADGVVIHAELFSTHYAKEFGISSEEMLPFFLGDFGACLIGKADLKQMVTPRLSKRKWPGTVDTFLTYRFESENNPDADLLAYIQELRKQGFICCLATNQEYYRGEFMKNSMQFNNLFDHVFISADLGAKKPYPHYFEQIRTLLQQQSHTPIAFQDIIFFDDTQENINAAKTLGIDAHFYTKAQGIARIKSIIEEQ